MGQLHAVVTEVSDARPECLRIFLLEFQLSKLSLERLERVERGFGYRPVAIEQRSARICW